MEESFLIKISFSCSIIGLVSLFLISSFVDEGSINIGSVTSSDIGTIVKLCGNVTNKYTTKNKHVFMNLKDETGEIKVVVFNQTASKFNLNLIELNRVCITGKVNIYRGELEIIANRVETYGP